MNQMNLLLKLNYSLILYNNKMDTILNIDIVNDISNIPELSNEIIEMINDD